MLQFDHERRRLLYYGIAIGGSRPDELAERLNTTLQDVQGHLGRQQLKVAGRPLNLVAGFRDGLLQDGYFWADVPSGGTWDDLERTEAARRARHEEIMRSLFGGPAHRSPDLSVRLLRDPRDSMERIAFEVP